MTAIKIKKGTWPSKACVGEAGAPVGAGTAPSARITFRQFRCIIRKTVGQFKKANTKGKIYCPEFYADRPGRRQCRLTPCLILTFELPRRGCRPPPRSAAL